jgi:xylulokinase
VRYRNAGGAVVTNCVFAALASGAISEDGVRAALEKTIVRDALYEPNAENGALYRRLFNLKQQLVKQDMRKAFATLTSMRSA